MSDQPPKPKPGSLRDRIAAFEKGPQSSGSTPAPPPIAPRPKPTGMTWKPKPPSPPDSPNTATSSADTPVLSAVGARPAGGMSASDAKESIGKAGSLKERMAALQGRGGFGGPVAGGPPPIAPGPKPPTTPRWKPPVVASSAESEGGEEGASDAGVANAREDVTQPEVSVRKASIDGSRAPIRKASVDVQRTEESQGETQKDDQGTHAESADGEDATAQEPDPEEEERQRRAAIAARMARLGGARVGMAPMFGKPPPPPPPKKVDVQKVDSGPTSPRVEERKPSAESIAHTTQSEDVSTTPQGQAVEAEAAEKSTSVSPPLPMPVRKASQSESIKSQQGDSESTVQRGSPSSMPVPIVPRRAGPPRKKPVKSPPVVVPQETEEEGVVEEHKSEEVKAVEGEAVIPDVSVKTEEAEVRANLEEVKSPKEVAPEEVEVVVPAEAGGEREVKREEEEREVKKEEEEEEREVRKEEEEVVIPADTRHEEAGEVDADRPDEEEAIPQVLYDEEVKPDDEDNIESTDHHAVPSAHAQETPTDEHHAVPKETTEENEDEEEEVARRKRIAERLAKMGGINPFAPPPPSLPRRTTSSSLSPSATVEAFPVTRSLSDESKRGDSHDIQGGGKQLNSEEPIEAETDGDDAQSTQPTYQSPPREVTATTVGSRGSSRKASTGSNYSDDVKQKASAESEVKEGADDQDEDRDDRFDDATENNEVDNESEREGAGDDDVGHRGSTAVRDDGGAPEDHQHEERDFDSDREDVEMAGSVFLTRPGGHDEGKPKVYASHAEREEERGGEEEEEEGGAEESDEDQAMSQSVDFVPPPPPPTIPQTTRPTHSVLPPPPVRSVPLPPRLMPQTPEKEDQDERGDEFSDVVPSSPSQQRQQQRQRQESSEASRGYRRSLGEDNAVRLPPRRVFADGDSTDGDGDSAVPLPIPHRKSLEEHAADNASAGVGANTHSSERVAVGKPNRGLPPPPPPPPGPSSQSYRVEDDGEQDGDEQGERDSEVESRYSEAREEQSGSEYDEVLPTLPRRHLESHHQSEHGDDSYVGSDGDGEMGRNDEIPLIIPPPPPPRFGRDVDSPQDQPSASAIRRALLPKLQREQSHGSDQASPSLLTPTLSLSDHQEILDEEEGDPIDPGFHSPSRRTSAIFHESPVIPRSRTSSGEENSAAAEETLPVPPPVKSTGSIEARGEEAEDADQTRRQTIAERMAKLGGIKFGAAPLIRPRPPPPPRLESREEGEKWNVERGDDREEGGEGTEEGVVGEEVDEEEEERARKARISAKLVGMGGMRIGMMPMGGMLPRQSYVSKEEPPLPPARSGLSPPQRAVPPPVRAPPPPQIQAHETDSEHGSQGASDDGVKVEAEESEIEEVGYEEVEEAPPIPTRVPRRTSIPAPDSSIDRSIQSSTYVPGPRPPVPYAAPPSRRSTAQTTIGRKSSTDSSTTTQPQKTSSAHKGQSEYVMVEEPHGFDTDDGPPPPLPPGRPGSRAPPGRGVPPPPPPPIPSASETADSISSQWELPSIPMSTLDFSTSPDLSLSWAEESVGDIQAASPVPPPRRQSAQAYAAPSHETTTTSRLPPTLEPPRLNPETMIMSVDDLMAVWGRVGVQVCEVATSLFDKSKRTLVGDGSHHGFVRAVLSEVPNAAVLPPPSYGYLVYVQNGGSVQKRTSEILPGDVVELHDAKLKGHKGIHTYNQSVGVGEALVGVVSEFEPKKSKIRVFQANQHVGQQTVESVSYRLEDLKSGTVKVYRILEARG